MLAIGYLSRTRFFQLDDRLSDRYILQVLQLRQRYVTGFARLLTFQQSRGARQRTNQFSRNGYLDRRNCLDLRLYSFEPATTLPKISTRCYRSIGLVGPLT